jgi:hypothetical protein
MNFRAYIEREGVELEVTAELYDNGYGYDDKWADTGHTFVVTHEPLFWKHYCEDDNGNVVVLTAEEIEAVNARLIEQYWDNEL